MKTYVINKDGTAGVREVGIPAYNEHEALVKMISCGMCGTDVKLFHRTFKKFPESRYPLMLGHEGVGEVIAVGEKVKGYKIGDKVLQKIAVTLLQSFRADDYVCRIGGDEFMVLMVHINEGVQRMIENKVRQINADLADTADGLPPVSVSVGVSLRSDADDPQERFHEADIALYYVKDHGRSGCCFYKPGMREKTSGTSPLQ